MSGQGNTRGGLTVGPGKPEASGSEWERCNGRGKEVPLGAISQHVRFSEYNLDESAHLRRTAGRALSRVDVNIPPTPDS